VRRGRFARELAAGLAHLPAAGMVHRDVKPSNCLFVGRTLKLADFGLLMPAAANLSRLGTVRYMPPDGRMDLRADVYAAGPEDWMAATGIPAQIPAPSAAVRGHREPSRLHEDRKETLDVSRNATVKYPREGSNL
jgi:serine/threonine protein kinase